MALRKMAATAIWGIAVFAAAGCASTVAESSPSLNAVFLSDLLIEARAGGADEVQIGVLENAMTRGEITYEDAVGQLERFFDCMRDFGATPIRGDDRFLAPDYRVPTYTLRLPDNMVEDDPDLTMINGCQTTHLEFVMRGRYLQPTSIEVQNADMEAHRAAIELCIKQNGGDIDDEATIDELSNAVVTVYDTTGVQCWFFG